MVTAVTAITSADVAKVSAEAPAQLSDVTQNALSNLGQMQTDFTQSMEAIGTNIDKVDTATQAQSGPVSDNFNTDLAELSRMMEASTNVQLQLLQFTMATSLSSSTGRNLNTFLKGQ